MPWEFPHPRRLRRIHALQVSLLIVAWAVLSAWLAALPVVLVEPDDEMFYAAMKLFAKDEILWRRSEIAEAMRPLEFVRGPGFGSPLPPFFQPSGTGTDLLGIEKSPGHPAALALAYKLGLVDWLGPLLALVSCLFLYALVRRLGEERGWAATAAALLLLLNANSIAGQWRIYMSDYSSAIQVAMGMGLYLWARESGRLWLFALSGLWLAIAVAFRYTNVLAIGAVALYEVIRAFEGGWRGALMRFLKHKGHWAAAAGAIVGLLPLCWYLLELTGSPLRTGYADRFDRQYSSYFSLSLHDPRALFSLGHVPKVFFSGFPMFLLGFPLLPLAVAGLGAMPRRRSRPALFLGLWAAAFWAPHLCYGWVRADAFVFMCRKFLPSLGALCILAAAALARLAGGDWAAEGGVEDSEESAASGPSARGARLAAVATFLVLILFGLSLGIDFCVRYGVYGQGRVARESWGRW
ncbi:MAG: hypothetical protein NTW86_28235, partial [Candidatus Sumerlaeota bacterium]|nr:hypothetical protein [Candidatus Sumerlaeota bacterium]